MGVERQDKVNSLFHIWPKTVNVIGRVKLAENWQVDRLLIILKTNKWPKVSSAHLLGLFPTIFKHVY